MQHLYGLGEFENPVVRGHLVERALEGPLGAGAVVAADVDNQRVVDFPFVLDFLNDPADLMIGIGYVGGKHLGLMRIELLLDQRKGVPLRQDIRPRRELGTRRNDAEPLLVDENLLAQLLPAHVELAFVLLDPFLRRLVRRVGAPGHVIQKERLVGRRGVQSAQVLDGLVRQVGRKVITGLAEPGKYRGVVPVKIRRPLISLAAHEAVKIVETHAARPLIERPRHAVQIGGGVMVLAEPGGGKSILFQDLTDRGAFRSDDRVIAREAGGHLADDAESHRMMIAPSDERRARRRAEGG